MPAEKVQSYVQEHAEDWHNNEDNQLAWFREAATTEFISTLGSAWFDEFGIDWFLWTQQTLDDGANQLTWDYVYGPLIAVGMTIVPPLGGPAPRGRGKFASDDLLREHQGRHGPALGCRTAAAYEKQAGEFLIGPKGPNVLEKVRPDGTILRFDTITNEFGVVNPNGTVRSYYIPKPNSAGAGGHNYTTNLEYFHAQ